LFFFYLFARACLSELLYLVALKQPQVWDLIVILGLCYIIEERDVLWQYFFQIGSLFSFEEHEVGGKKEIIFPTIHRKKIKIYLK
jgi:hypothetical protein